MSAYVVVTDSSDYEELPSIFGPFASDAAADAFALTCPWSPIDGGYSQCVVIHDGEDFTAPCAAWWHDDDQTDPFLPTTAAVRAVPIIDNKETP